MPPKLIREFAPAKVNLALHITGQRADGYHLLDSLVVFAGIGDLVSCAPAPSLSLTLSGPQAAALTSSADNLVMRAARLMSQGDGAAIDLEKHLPVASGIGGGSADAAATLRALSRLWARPVPPSVLDLGADVPACLSSAPKRMQGIGEKLSPVRPLPECHLVLINPGVAVSTPDVFKALVYKDNSAFPDIPTFALAHDLAEWLAYQRNDLQAPALALVPVIGAVLKALSAHPGCHLARMSGSGATCFGLFSTQAESAKAAQTIAVAQPDWWVRSAPVLS